VVDGVTAEGLQAAGVARAVAAPPTLVPLRMPPRSGERYDAVRDHLRGRLVLSLRIDGSGDVQTVAVQQSSGDPVLDDYARRLVAGWQFAVPPGYPAGLSGELPMRFDDARADSRP
jgi:protein TonB